MAARPSEVGRVRSEVGRHRRTTTTNSRSTWVVGFVGAVVQGSGVAQMIIKASKAAVNAVAGVVIALLLIFAYDRLADPIWDEYAEPISIDIDHVVLHLHGNKVRALDLASPPQIAAFALDNQGARRLVDIEAVSGQGPASFPRGWIDLGWWKFTDTSPAPRPITEVEIEIEYLCILGKCTKTLGPFTVD